MPVSVSSGGLNLTSLSCGRLPPQPQPVCFSNPPETSRQRDREAQEALSAAGLKARARHRHPIKAVGTPCSELSQLGCVRAQIFEKCPTVRVPLARHHRLPLPKQKRREGVWMLGMCKTHVCTDVSLVPLLTSPTYQVDMEVWTVCINIYTLMFFGFANIFLFK